MKLTAIVLGVLAAILIVAQLVMGVVLAQGGASVGLMKSHQHTGYLTFVVIIAYIGLSLTMIVSQPRQASPRVNSIVDFEQWVDVPFSGKETDQEACAGLVAEHGADALARRGCGR